MIGSHHLLVAVLCLASALMGCVAPRSVVALEKLKLEGEPYYVEHRRHECGGQAAGFVCVHSCRSTLWNVWRTSGAPQQKLEALDQQMISLGFEHREDRDAKEKERDYWWLLYEGGAMIIMGHASPDGMLSIWPPTRDATSLEGEYVYGVETSYQSPWDWLDGRWRNITWLFRECSGGPGLPRPRSQRR